MMPGPPPETTEKPASERRRAISSASTRARCGPCLLRRRRPAAEVFRSYLTLYENPAVGGWIVVPVPRVSRAAGLAQCARRTYGCDLWRAQHATTARRGLQAGLARLRVRRQGPDFPRRLVRRIQGAPSAHAGGAGAPDRAAA